MKIGVDFDDVLLDCNGSLALFHNNRYGTSYDREDIRVWDLGHLWGCTQEEMIARIKEWYYSPEHTSARPVSGAIALIGELSKAHELHIITARPTYVREPTQEWLDKYFPDQFSGIYFTNHFEPDAGTKSEICRNLGVSLLIEDSLMHARDVAESGVTVLLVDCPWNQEKVSGNIIRIFTLDDALNFVASYRAPAA